MHLLSLVAAAMIAATASQNASIVVTVDRTHATEALHVDLLQGGAEVLSTRDLASSAREARFDNLAPGVYRIVLRGRGALERLSARAVLGSGDTLRIELAPKPRAATIRVIRAGKPLDGATVELAHEEHGWRSRVAANEETTLWEPGMFEIAVRGAGLVTPHAGRIELGAGTTTIDVPSGSIGGFVRDTAGAAIPRAMVVLSTTHNGLTTTVRTKSDAMGRFDFTAVAAGRQTLRADAPGFLWLEPVTFEANERELDLVLDRGRSRTVSVMASDGTPVSGAFIAATNNASISATAITGDDGRAIVATPAGGATLFVVPKDGSFAIRRIGADEARVRVDVPPAAASLEVAMLTTAGAPISEVSVLLRYNGELVPPDVSRELERRQRLRLITDSEGRIQLARVPRGTYELWPYRSQEEADALVASASAIEAPANVNVVTGENRVTLRFRSR
jgi:hypothetical protein